MTAGAPRQQSGRTVAVAASALVAVVALTFAADVVAPNTAAVHMFYALPILLTWFIPLGWSTEAAGAAAIALNLVGFWVAPGELSTLAIADHAMAVGLFIVVTVLLGRAKRARAREVANDTKVRESEARFRALTQATSDVVYRMSPDWTEMRHLVGREFIVDTNQPSRTWLDTYIHPDDQPHVRATIEKAVLTKSVFSLVHRVRQVDGSLGWTTSRAVPILGADGEILEWFGAASDVTERVQAQEDARADLEAMTRLHQLGTLVARHETLPHLLATVVDTAIAISTADFGSVQLLDSATGDLKIVAQRGFPDWWLAYWDSVAAGQGVCGTALERGERVIVEDVEQSPIFVGTPALDI